MKLTKRGEYGLRALLALAMVHGQRTLSLREISSKENLPTKFLEQIMMVLKRSNLVESVKGKHGGYSLSRSPEKITVGEVIRAVDGPLAPIANAREIQKQIQKVDRHAGLYVILLDVRNAISEILDHKSLADICNQSLEIARSKGTEQMYYI
ncbi:MAG: Rrf2 family transcriptional regulator [Candidatus Omnitrophica bacterium]|nr:Rrf2 family transcriptional regulator [Candidatus Omnitrophota bacterium]